MSSVHQICLRWNNHLTNFPKMFEELRKNKDLLDVTLYCEGRKIMAHKLVLSACSTYFQTLFNEIPCKHPVIFFRDVPYSELESVINYMYKGEVSVGRDSLDTFLKTAESLQVKGLVQDCEDNIPAVKETIPMATKPKPHRPSSIPEPSPPTPASSSSTHVPKESQWSQSFTSHQTKAPSTPKENAQSSQSTTFTPTQATFTPAPTTTFTPSHSQPPTPQSVGAGSSLHSHPDEAEDDDDVIIEPEIKFEAMDHGDSVSGDGDCARDGQDMDSEMYMDEPSETFTHTDRLAHEITSIMSNLSNQSGSGHSTSMEMNMGPSTSQGQDQHSEELPRKKERKSWKRLSLEQKLQIIELVLSNSSVADVAKQFDVSTTAVQYIVKNSEKYRDQYTQVKQIFANYALGKR